MTDHTVPDNIDEQWRLECEAREWLKRGYTSKAKVDELIAEIAKKRGKDAAEKLRDEMRQQYRKEY